MANASATSALLKTLPRAANVSLASLIAEIGPLLERCENPEQVAAICGAAPVTKASGESSSAWADDCYRRARARGVRHPHAIRILARGWVRVLWACWTTDTAYDPSRHRGEQRLAAATRPRELKRNVAREVFTIIKPIATLMETPTPAARHP